MCCVVCQRCVRVYVCTCVQVAETLLRKGFSSPGSGPIDIFGVAAALAEGNAPFKLSLSCYRSCRHPCVAVCSCKTFCLFGSLCQ